MNHDLPRRLLRWLLIALGVLAAAWLGMWVIKANDRATVVICRAEYGRAKTAMDTAAIDLRRPFLGRKDAIGGPSCGLLRVQGKL